MFEPSLSLYPDAIERCPLGPCEIPTKDFYWMLFNRQSGLDYGFLIRYKVMSYKLYSSVLDTVYSGFRTKALHWHIYSVAEYCASVWGRSVHCGKVEVQLNRTTPIVQVYLKLMATHHLQAWGDCLTLLQRNILIVIGNVIFFFET